MALPEIGSLNWGTALNNWLGTEHEADGTHKKADLVSTLGFSPTSVGSTTQSVTLPNGLIVKFGKKATTSTLQTIDFTTEGGADFPTGILYANVIAYHATTSINNSGVMIKTIDVSGITYYNASGASTQGIYWLAIGY